MANTVKVKFDSGAASADVVLSIRTRTIRDGNHNIARLQRELRAHHLVPSERAIDLFTIALGVQIADLRVQRSKSPDGWTRQIELEVEVEDPAAWGSAAPELAGTLGFLSNDLWSFRFIQRAASSTEIGFAGRLRRSTASGFDSVCLFSGGLDSCIGAIDLLERGASPLFVSCQNDAAANRAQTNVSRSLSRYPAFKRVGLGAEFRLPGPKEASQRARSFLFIATAGLAASAIGAGVRLVVPENGLIALNPPLEPHRIGALSTRTAHPRFLSGVQRVVDSVGLGFRIDNPYELFTKGEMMAACSSQEFLAEVASETVSCGKANVANINKKSHCGACVPCIIRRAAFRAWGGVDRTTYLEDLSGGEHPARELAGEDARAFKSALANLPSDASGAIREVRRSGPLGTDGEQIARYAALYLRGMHEVAALLSLTRTVGV